MLLYRTDFTVLLGKADVIQLRYEDDPNACTVEEEYAIIPRAAPTVVAVCREDDDPNVDNVLTIYVFDGRQWRRTSYNLGDNPCPLL